MKICKISWLIAFQITVVLFPSLGHAKTADFQTFKDACPALKTRLASGEKKINALKLSDSKLLRVQLEQYLAISKAKASGGDCRKIKDFFSQQAGLTKAALRTRANTSAARAQQMQAQLNQFVADMETLEVVLNAASAVIGGKPVGTPAQPSAGDVRQSLAGASGNAASCLRASLVSESGSELGTTSSQMLRFSNQCNYWIDCTFSNYEDPSAIGPASMGEWDSTAIVILGTRVKKCTKQ